ncbi:phytase, partial [Candidatus Parcubacteria bacterium]|nr:phytase [Candidatus Parcubacteria bacterium]
MKKTVLAVFSVIILSVALCGGAANAQAVSVTATVETAPVPHSSDAADDPAIWVHPTNAASSTIIGTDKLGGIGVYDLSGNQLGFFPDGKMNNVDLRYNFPLNGQFVDIVAATNRTNDSIALYKINPETRLLENVAARTILTGTAGIYGFCMYKSPVTLKYYAYANYTNGVVQQWEL